MKQILNDEVYKVKCSKCGEECKENQAFCLKCGNPIQIMPDFNLIEAELANSIGELMDDELKDKSETENNNQSDDDIKVAEMDVTNMELKLVDISRGQNRPSANAMDGKTKVIGDIKALAKEENIDLDEESWGSLEDEPVKKSVTSAKNNDKAQGNKPNKTNKKMLAAIITLVVIVIIIAVLLFIKFAGDVDDATTSYSDYLSSANEAFDNGEYDKAEEAARDAITKAKNQDEILEVRKLLFEIHDKSGKTSDYYVSNLEAMVELEIEDSKYYLTLAKYYDENEKYDNLTRMLVAIENEDILEALSDYVVEMPKADMDSGNYGEYIAVQLSAPEGYTIMYTTDSRNPSQYGEKYSEAIQLTEEGEHIIKAVAVNEKGVESKVATFTYDIELSGSNAPVLNPGGNVFDEYTTIMIEEIPEGAKAYYTWDGSKPTDKSEEYDPEKGIDMKRGINVLKVVIVDKYGITSEIAQESYNLQIARVINLNDAEALVKEQNASAEVSYISTEIIDNQEYYLFSSEVKNDDGDVSEITIYAVNTFDKKIEKASDAEGSYTIEENTED